MSGELLVDGEVEVLLEDGLVEDWLLDDCPLVVALLVLLEGEVVDWLVLVDGELWVA